MSKCLGSDIDLMPHPIPPIPGTTPPFGHPSQEEKEQSQTVQSYLKVA